MTADDYRRKAEALLRRAAESPNLKERGELIDQALHFHNLAMDAAGHSDGRVNDNRDTTAPAEARFDTDDEQEQRA